MTIKIEIKEKDGLKYTRVVEEEGAALGVRNYADPDDAINYLNSRVPYYRQPVVAEEKLVKGSAAVDENGEDILVFANLQSAMAHLRKKVLTEDAEVKKDKEDGKVEEGAVTEGKEGVDKKEPAPSGTDDEKDLTENKS